ncbi:MAG: conjugal transfer protein TraF [Maricaulaceae bacterium]
MIVKTVTSLFGILGVFMLWMTPQSYAQSSDFYCDDRELGGQFYCEIPEEEVVEIPDPPPGASPSEIKDFNQFKERLAEARAVAVFSGKREDVQAYMKLQKEAADMSTRFMTQYQFIGWQDPSLSYTSAVPIETGAKRVYMAERRREVERHVKGINDRYGMFYFYSNKCPACKQFGPVVKMLSARYDLTVVPIAKKGRESIEWPGTKPDNGIGERVGLYGDVTPALVLYDADQDAGVVISYGVVSLESLENRIYMLTRDEKVKFLGGDDDVR